MKNIFRNNQSRYRGVGPQCRAFLIYQSTTINQKLSGMSLLFLNFWKACTETIKNIKYNLLKMKRSVYITFFYQNHKRAWNWFPVFIITQVYKELKTS